MNTRTRIAAGVGLLTLSACTPQQLERFESITSTRLEPAVRTQLEALPDESMSIGGTSVITPSGEIEQRRERHCDQWRQTMLAAGWDAYVFDSWASAIMWRESHCNPSAISRTNDYGLMQINGVVLADMRQRPERWREALDKIGHVPTKSELLNPTINAIVSHVLYTINGRTPW